MLQGRQQEGAEFALAAVHRGQEVRSQQPSEKLLREVLGLVRFMPAAAEEGIERIPIGAAQFGHGLGCPRRFLPACGGQDDGPVRGGEARGIGVSGGRHLLGHTASMFSRSEYTSRR